MTDVQRWVELDGAHNVRDVGGWATAEGALVRPGRVFRADSLDLCSERDLALLREELGIRCVIDLRARRRDRSPLGPDVRFIAIPFDQDLRAPRDVVNDPVGGGLVTLYLEYFTSAREQVAAAVRAIAAHCHEPVLVHCSFGKDRTGVVVAVLLSVLGVPPASIVADYALTDERVPRLVERLQNSGREIDGVPPEMLRARPETMRAVLAQLCEQEGSVESWAAGSGLGPDHVEQLRSELLAPPQSGTMTARPETFPARTAATASGARLSGT